jgi:hypothetical protein
MRQISEALSPVLSDKKGTFYVGNITGIDWRKKDVWCG